MSNLADYTVFNFPSSSAPTISVTSFVDGLISFTDGYPHLIGTTNVTLTGMSNGYNRTIINSTLQGLTILPGSISVPAASCALLTYNGSVWSQLISFSGSTLGPGSAAGGDLSGTYPNPNVASITGNAGVVNVASTGNIITWNAATTAPTIKQTTATLAATPQSLTLFPQAPNASSSGTTPGTPGNLLITLSAPVSTGIEASFNINRASTNLISIGANASFSASPQISFQGGGYIRADNTNGGSLNVAAPTSQFVYFLNGTNEFAHFGGSNLVLTGTSVIEYIAGSGFTIGASNIATPNLGPHTFLIESEQSNASSTINPNGGLLALVGGSGAIPGSVGTSGSVAMSLNSLTTQRLVEAAEVAVNSRGVALAQIGSGVTSTNVPSGDGWVWVGKANTNPGIPTGGFLLWSDHTNGDGYYCNPGGTPTLLGTPNYPLLNPTINGSSTYLPTTAQIASQGINGAEVITQMWGVRTTNAVGTALIGSFPVDGYAGAPFSSGVIEFDVIHMMVATTGSPLSAAKFKSSFSWSVSSSGLVTPMGSMSQPVAVGTASGGNPPSGWSSTIQLSGSQIQVIATGDSVLTVNHSALVQILYSS